MCRSAWIHTACLYPRLSQWLCADCNDDAPNTGNTRPPNNPSSDPKGKRKLFAESSGSSSSANVPPSASDPYSSCPLCEKGYVLEGNTVCFSCFSGQPSDDELVLPPAEGDGHQGEGHQDEGDVGEDAAHGVDDDNPPVICGQCGADEAYDDFLCYDCFHL